MTYSNTYFLNTNRTNCTNKDSLDSSDSCSKKRSIRVKMIRVVMVFALALVAGCATRTEKVMLTEWSVEYGGKEYPARVPGFVHTDLMANGLIPDPYYGTNEDSVRWVGERKWTYTLHLDRSRLPKGDTLWVVFEGLAGVADIVFYNNIQQPDTMISYTSDNMFVEQAYPLPDFAEDIMVQFYPLYDSCREAEYGIALPDRRAFTRIAPYQQGWDWGPKMPTCGIWKPVYIISNEELGIRNKKPFGAKANSSFLITNSSFHVELRQEKDAIGQSFTFYKDGEPVFIKGANWIPVHSFPVLDSANRARYRLLLTAAKEAGFNMLRVWGGGIYEHDYFFDLCDSLGLMVWMDFNFSTMLYPDNPEMLESIREEARQNITRIARHPCVVLWCGNNEVKNGWEDWGWQGVYHWSPRSGRSWRRQWIPFSGMLVGLVTLVRLVFWRRWCGSATPTGGPTSPPRRSSGGDTRSASPTATATTGASGGARSRSRCMPRRRGGS